MKRSIICIIIIIILGIILWYYFDGEMKKVEAERDAAIELAIAEALENSRSRGVAKEPPVRTKIVYVEKEVAAKEPAQPKKDPDMFTDERDGKQYKFIDVNGSIWMADNLNFESEGSWCYEGNAENCNNWGRLYTWNAATEVCPDGWHLPDDEEWGKLIWHYGGNDVAGKALKEGGSSGFEAMMAGYRDKKGFYGKVDSSAYYWSSTEQNEHYASFKGMYHHYSNVGPYTYTKPDGFSVRCMKNPAE